MSSSPSLRRSSRIAALVEAAPPVAPAVTRSGRVSKAPARFSEEVFRELPMANNKHTAGRKIRVGIPIESAARSSRAPVAGADALGTANRDALKWIMENVYALCTAGPEEAAEILEDLLDDVCTIADSAPQNEKLQDAKRLFYAAFSNAERITEDELSESTVARVLRTLQNQAVAGYKLLAGNVQVV